MPARRTVRPSRASATRRSDDPRTPPPRRPARRRCGICASSVASSADGGSIPVPSVASPSAPSSSAATAHEPSPSANATSSSVARRKPRPGARNEIASIRLVLPAPFGPTSTASCASTVSARGAIAAEIRQRQAADAGGAHRVPGAAVPVPGGFHKSLTNMRKMPSGPRRELERIRQPAISLMERGQSPEERARRRRRERPCRKRCRKI